MVLRGRSPDRRRIRLYLFFLKSVRAVIRFRRLLNQPCGQYEALEARVTAALRGRFYDEETGSFAGGEQGADALALELGIAPDGEEGRLRANLVERYRKIGAFDTGSSACCRSAASSPRRERPRCFTAC